MGSLPNGTKPGPAQELYSILDEELDTAVTAERRGQKVYHSLQRMSQLIGGEYGDRVIYELLQNAHDAQRGAPGRVAIHLVVDGADHGQLFVANGGDGFALENLQAIRNIANSTKDIGEGIGNKGVGFRSIEALTDDPHVFSCNGKAESREHFDGYCFRLASEQEVEQRLVQLGYLDVASAVAASMPRYLATMPVEEQPDEVRTFAREGYATVVVLPLRSPEAVALAIRQVAELVEADAPVLLFLDRIASLEVCVSGVVHLKPRMLLTRHVVVLQEDNQDALPTRFEIVMLGPNRQRWLVVRRTVSKENVIDAVKRSIVLEPGLKRWIDWRGDAIVSVAVPAEGHGLRKGRLYNFLPMGVDSQSPFFGHLDAPFFTAINRERARLDLPLNAYFLAAAAEICATAALVLSKSLRNMPPRCVVDMATWRSNDAQKLAAGFHASGVNITKAEIWPTTAGGWQSLRLVRSWPKGEFKVFTWSRATKAGVQNVLSTILGIDRLTAIESLARSLQLTCAPSKQSMAEWAEAIAQSLPRFSKGDRWGSYYAELSQVLRHDGLSQLRGRHILLNKDSDLVVASEDVFVRQDGGRRRRNEMAPLPPATLSRKLTILSDTIKLSPETVSLFERAGLWRRYDATEILERLPTLFGNKPAVARREAALLWAFDVWRYDGPAARRALEKADLHVLTRSGWIPAKKASFSQTWTEVGRDLDFYLAEARGRCENCKESAESLLVDVIAWPTGVEHRQDWLRFLSDAGVIDGLIAVPVYIPDKPIWGGNIQFELCNTKDMAMDAVWWSNCGFSAVAHPQTHYWVGGHVFKLPGQTIVHTLSDESRRRFAALVVRHLQIFEHKHLTFELLRKDRDLRHQDKHTLRTPISTFLSTASWFPMESARGYEFVPPSEGWSIAERRTQLKFIPRAPEEIQVLLRDGATVSTLLAAEPFGLRFWHEKSTAADRLEVLASVCNDINQHERPQLRKYYDEAWQDLLEIGQRPNAASLIVESSTGFELLAAADPSVSVYIKTERTMDLAKLLIDTGEAVLVTGIECPVEPLIRTINSIGGFDARTVDEANIRLLADGERFRVSTADPLLVDIVPWLAEALVLGHELGARSIEKSANVGAVLERLRRLRLRQLSSIELASGTGASKKLNRYIYRDEDCPTLLVTGLFDAEGLGDAASLIAPYVHPNLRTFELLLVRLAFRLRGGIALASSKPSETDYAYAVQADLDAVREHLAAYRHDDARKVELLIPLVAYYADIEVARELTHLLSNAGFTQWTLILEKYLSHEVAQKLIAAIQQTEDLPVLRRELNLDYRRFNRILIELGRGSLASESELRRLFDLWMNELRPDLRDRLRRHFAFRFEEPTALALYAERRNLDFVTFDANWIETYETLGREDVRLYAERIFDDAFGDDTRVELPALEALRISNRKAVMSIVQRAKPILLASVSGGLARVWSEGPAEIAAVLDRSGGLDFFLVDEAETIVLLNRVGLWPAGLAQTLDLNVHGLTMEDLDRERLHAAALQMKEKAQRNRVEFGGNEFDASDDDFAYRFANMAHAAFASNSWQERTSLRLVRLATQPEYDGGGYRGRGGRGISRLPPRPPEAVRAAIGLAGELLAYRYLERKHRDHFSDQCWVSENRVSLFPEEGDLTLGYDFRVNTKEREWLYEVKATPGEACEFELSDNEYRVAISAAADRKRRYRILFIQYAFDPERCRVLELPNPAAETGKSHFRIVGRSSVRMRFDCLS